MHLCALVIMLHWTTMTQSFAFWMENDFCDRSLMPGTVIMNERAILSSEGRVRVFRGDSFQEEMFSHDLYFSGEQVLVRLQVDDETAAGAEVVFEARGAVFPAGGCGGRRSSREGSLLRLPEVSSSAERQVVGRGEGEGEGEVRVWAGEQPACGWRVSAIK